MDDCPYMYVERDGNAHITMCSLHPNEIWGVSERTCMHCANADPAWREWKLSLGENNGYPVYEIPTRQCLVCERMEIPGATIVNEGEAWLCPECKSRIKKLIYGEEANG